MQISTPEDSSCDKCSTPEPEDVNDIEFDDGISKPSAEHTIAELSKQIDETNGFKDKRLSDIIVPPPESTSASCSSSSQPQQSVYHIKWVCFLGQKVATITQNENGPCPLLAIVNVLLLRTKIKMPTGVEVISAEKLMEYLTDCIFDNTPNVGFHILLHFFYILI